MHHLLKVRVQSAYDRMQFAAKKCGAPVLDFSHARLALMVIEAIDKPCEYCSQLFGLEQFGVVCDVPPERRVGFPASRGLANVSVCCATWGAAKGSAGRLRVARCDVCFARSRQRCGVGDVGRAG